MDKGLICETARLRLREFTEADAAYIVQQLNEPSFIRNIADRGVRTLDDAKLFLRDRLIASYREHGHGMWAVELKTDQTVIGMCGILRREGLDEADVGYAFLPAHWSRGYAAEAAVAAIQWAKQHLNKTHLLAIVNNDNKGSIALLDKLGFVYQRMIALYPNEPEIRLYRLEL
jgi:RimJ/RimL family protein N-acetyltransferase